MCPSLHRNSTASLWKEGEQKEEVQRTRRQEGVKGMKIFRMYIPDALGRVTM